MLHARLFERERQLVEELQNLDRYKTDLIATISHELKNPLTSVMGHLELIQPVAETSAARSLGAISRNAARLEMMVEDLLLLSKVGDPTRPLIPVEVDLVPLLDDTVEMLRIQTERRGVALRLDHPGPRSSPGATAASSSGWSPTSSATRSSSRPRAAPCR